VELYLHSPNTPSWLGAQLNTGTTLPFTASRSATGYVGIAGLFYEGLVKEALCQRKEAEDISLGCAISRRVCKLHNTDTQLLMIGVVGSWQKLTHHFYRFIGK
jgi:hypothetical protein